MVYAQTNNNLLGSCKVTSMLLEENNLSWHQHKKKKSTFDFTTYFDIDWAENYDD